MSGELPVGWSACTLGDIVERIETGKSVKCDERPPLGEENGLVKISAVTWGKFNEQESKTLFDSSHLKPEEKIQLGDFLISRANTLELVGSCVLVKQLSKSLYLSDKVLRLVLADESKPWLLTCLRTQNGRKQIESLATGNQLSMRNISQQALNAIHIPLPPLAEQTRIAQKLDELLSQVDTLKARIDAIPVLLKRFRQSVLAAAVSGRFTEEWRINEGVNHSANEHLLEELIEESLVGLVRSAKEQSDSPNGSPYLKMNNINNDWGHNNIKLTYVSATTAELSRYQLRKGDWLFNTRNSLELVGKSCVWKGGNGFVFNNNILRLRLKEKALPEYIEIWFRSPHGQAQLNEIKSATTSVAAIYQKALMQQVVALPSLAEQTEIVRRVEQLFAFADQLEAKIKTAQARVNHLTQSILAKAFRGELVPQDPNDEPAGVLLQRIQIQRAAAPKAKRGRKASA